MKDVQNFFDWRDGRSDEVRFNEWKSQNEDLIKDLLKSTSSKKVFWDSKNYKKDFNWKMEYYKERLRNGDSFLFFFSKFYQNNFSSIFFYWKYVYQDYIIFTLINFLMKNGKKNKTFSFFFRCLFLLKKKLGMNPIFLIKLVLLKRNWMIQLTKKQFHKKVFFFTRVLDFKRQIRQCVSKFIDSVNWLKSKRKISFWKSFFLLVLNHHIIEKKKKKIFFDYNQKIDRWIFFFFYKLKQREKKFDQWSFLFRSWKNLLNFFIKFFQILCMVKEKFYYFFDSYFFFFEKIFLKWKKKFFFHFYFLFFFKKNFLIFFKNQKNFYWLNYYIFIQRYHNFMLSFFQIFFFWFFQIFYFFFSFYKFFFFDFFLNWWIFIKYWKKKFSLIFYWLIKKFFLNFFYLNFLKKRILYLKDRKKNRKNNFHLKFILPNKFSTKDLLKNKKFLINFKPFNKIYDEQQRNQRLHSFYDVKLKHRHLFLRRSKFGQR